MVRQRERERERGGGGGERERESRMGRRSNRYCLCFSCVWHPGSAPQLVSIDEKQLNLFKITGDSAKVHAPIIRIFLFK